MNARALRPFLLVASALQLAACVETFDASYVTFAEAQSKGAVVAGGGARMTPSNGHRHTGSAQPRHESLHALVLGAKGHAVELAPRLRAGSSA